jgi:hypothetical protein
MFGLLNNPLDCSPILLMRGGSYSTATEPVNNEFIAAIMIIVILARKMEHDVLF